MLFLIQFQSLVTYNNKKKKKKNQENNKKNQKYIKTSEEVKEKYTRLSDT